MLEEYVFTHLWGGYSRREIYTLERERRGEDRSMWPVFHGP